METLHREWKLSEFPDAMKRRDEEANRLRKEGYEVLTYIHMNADLPKRERTVYCLIAIKKERRKHARTARRSKKESSRSEKTV